MAVVTVYSATGDGWVYSYNATYATARTGSGTKGVSTAGNTGTVGQSLDTGTYECDEVFMAFDVSGVPGVTGATAAALKVVFDLDSSTTDFTLTAGITSDFGTVTTADFISGADLSGLSTACTLSTAGISTGSYTTITNSGTVLLDQVKLGATVFLCFYSSRHSGNNTPAGYELVGVRMADYTGTTSDPKIEVTATPVGSASGGSPMGHLLVR